MIVGIKTRKIAMVTLVQIMNTALREKPCAKAAVESQMNAARVNQMLTNCLMVKKFYASLSIVEYL